MLEKIIVNGNVSKKEVDELVIEERHKMQSLGKQLAKVEITEINPEELEVKSWEKSPVRRVRRITGYLSTADRFNEAKLVELNNRVIHSVS